MKLTTRTTTVTLALAGLLAVSACSGPDTEANAKADQESREIQRADEILAAEGDDDITKIIQAAKARHGIDHWQGKDSLQADVEVIFGGDTMVNGTFTFEAHGPKARYDMEDGTVVVFDGKTAWALPADQANPMARFHVLTWPWFLLAPFKMDGDGTVLSDLKTHNIQDKEYIGVLQEFESDTGDTPDDWYRLFISPRSKKLEAMSYIVTYGKTEEEGNKRPSIVLYREHENVDGAQIPNAMEFWYWDKEKGLLKGDGPKGHATAGNMKFVQPEEGFYAKPEGAAEIPLPSQQPAE